ncbi:hypothetical protein [Chromobacterium phragmitis]|uniref:hypothetical protein n=1 Tax=Chromobacterium phragmitis TaxID=2202141 RepID=UPI00143D16A4|nr:hypothetical protein [Chromobacterium phragmitis]
MTEKKQKNSVKVVRVGNVSSNKEKAAQLNSNSFFTKKTDSTKTSFIRSQLQQLIKKS